MANWPTKALWKRAPSPLMAVRSRSRHCTGNPLFKRPTAKTRPPMPAPAMITLGLLVFCSRLWLVSTAGAAADAEQTVCLSETSCPTDRRDWRLLYRADLARCDLCRGDTGAPLRKHSAAPAGRPSADNILSWQCMATLRAPLSIGLVVPRGCESLEQKIFYD